MPVPSRTHRVETKYNVTTEFPHLGLHSAAANGNIGLVKYALSHGQPINSVLDGVLPLHAASSGGNDLVVKLLIEQGADVNASRLPRRYSDRHRDNSAPIVGSSGSTPLHFAAANGHTNVVRTLLLHGAHADRPDKHGVTPEMLAREYGMDDTVEVLKEWLANKDRDLRERGAVAEDEDEVGSLRDRRPSPCAALDALEHSVRMRLNMKRSIDRALNTLKASSHSLSESYSNAVPDVHPKRHLLTGRPTSPPVDTLFPDHPDYIEEEFLRRPSLLHEYDDPATSRSTRRPPLSSHIPDPAHLTAASASRKLGSKYSLRNLFKKAGDGLGPNLSDSPYSPSSAASTPSASPSPVPGVIPLPSSPRLTHALLSSSPHETSPLANGHRPRMASDSSVGNQAIDNYNPSVEHSMARSASRTGDDSNLPNSASSSRPGILLSHGRSSSSGQSQIQGSSFRALRFEASSSSSSLSAKARSSAARALGIKRSFSPSRMAQKSNSVNSLILGEAGIDDSVIRKITPGSAPAITADFEDTTVDAEDEEYGEVIERPDGSNNSHNAETEDPPRKLLAASSSSSLSRIVSTESAATSSPIKFPFSIHHPPPTDALDEQLLTVPYSPGPGDGRLRGDSVSSMSTEGSNDPHLSWSATTAASSSGSGSMMTPSISHLLLQNPAIFSPSSVSRDLLVAAEERKEETLSASDAQQLRFGTRRAHVPVDIDIRSISSHAQAEALVQRAQQSILDMESISDDDTLSTGRTPLSAKLAAYGESLALERRLKQAEEGQAAKDARSVKERGISHSRSATFVREGGRTNSSPHIRDIRVLETSKPSPNSHRSRMRQPRRPNTSDSTSSAMASPPFTNEGTSRPHHQQSHSASAVESHSAAQDILGDSAMVQSTSTRMPPSQPPFFSMQSPAEFFAGISPLSSPHTPDTALDDSTSVGRVQLSRYSTAPAQPSFADMLTGTTHDPATRHLASATKLTKMGFSAKDGYQPPLSVSPRQEPKSRFGIKSFFKGKS